MQNIVWKTSSAPVEDTMYLGKLHMYIWTNPALPPWKYTLYDREWAHLGFNPAEFKVDWIWVMMMFLHSRVHIGEAELIDVYGICKKRFIMGTVSQDYEVP